MKLRLGSSCNMGEYSFERLKKYGYECGDFQMANTDDEIYHVSDEEFVKRLEQVKGYADKNGIEIHQMHGPWVWPPREETKEGQVERFEKMSKSISAAPILGCKYWVIHPMLPFGVYDIHLNKEKENWDFNLDYFSRLTEVAKKHDVTICLENMPWNSYSIATPYRIVELVEAINDEHFQCCLDTGHIACFNNYPVGDAARTMGKHLKVLHVHDNHGGDSHELPYLGKINWENFYQGLCDIGYDGVFNFECQPPHWLLNGLSADLMERALVAIAKQILHENIEQNVCESASEKDADSLRKG